jgi:hypothetical protein
VGKVTACLAAALLAVAAPAPEEGDRNLLVNGSFEDGPDLPGTYGSFGEGSKEIKGWVVSRPGERFAPGRRKVIL